MKQFPNGVYSLFIIKINEDNSIQIQPNIFNPLKYEQHNNQILPCIENLANITNLEKETQRDLDIFDRPIPIQQNVAANWKAHIREILKSGKYSKPPTDSLWHLGNDEYKIENDPLDKRYKVPIEPDKKDVLKSENIYFERRLNVFNDSTQNAFMLKRHVPIVEHKELTQPIDWYRDEKTAYACVIIYPERTLQSCQKTYTLLDYKKFYTLCKFPKTYSEMHPNESQPKLDTDHIEILTGRHNKEIQPYIFLLEPLYEIALVIKDPRFDVRIYKLNFIKPVSMKGTLHIMEKPYDFYMNIFKLV